VRNLIKKILKEEREPLVFNGEDRTLTGKYRIVGDHAKYIEIENLQEYRGHHGKTHIGYMDGKMAGTSFLRKARLPKSQITIGETDEDGLTTITLPYWLYKKNDKNLRITKELDRNRYRVKSGD
jgi:hypothetical protein